MSQDLQRRRLLKGLAGLLAGVAVGEHTALAAAERPRVPAYAAREWVPYAFALPRDGSRLVGRPFYVSVRADETLLDLAREFNLGYWDIALANPQIDLWLPDEGARVLIPSHFILPDAPQEGIVINLAEMRLYYYPPPVQGQPRYVLTHPVGIGRQDWNSPLGLTRIVEMIPDPTWYPPVSIRAEHGAQGKPLPAVVPPGPDNPLGRHALILDIPGYLIHGTNQPAGVGMQVSHGCIRMYPEDIERLFGLVRRGVPVRLVNQPIKIAWSQTRLHAQLRPLPRQDEYQRLGRNSHRAVLTQLRDRLSSEAQAAGFLLPDAVDLGPALESGLPVTVPLI
jgi:L,D-transpeptidase ErfK/SrfK